MSTARLLPQPGGEEEQLADAIAQSVAALRSVLILVELAKQLFVRANNMADAGARRKLYAIAVIQNRTFRWCRNGRGALIETEEQALELSALMVTRQVKPSPTALAVGLTVTAATCMSASTHAALLPATLLPKRDPVSQHSPA